MNYRIFPPDGIIECRIAPPVSKSLSNRALVINAIAGAPSPGGLAICDDTQAMIKAIEDDNNDSTIDVGASGTAMRFLTALIAATPGRTANIDGCGRMRKRPIGPLVDALRSLGASIEYSGEKGFPPLRISGTRLRGGEISIAADVSSQFISALMLVAPSAESPLTINFDGDPVSGSYVTMTAELMRRQGIDVETSPASVTVCPGKYTHVESVDEADWSAASYWYEIAALSAGWIELEGLSVYSLQPDRHVTDIFADLCVDTDWNDDGTASLNPNPDQAPRLNIDLTDNPDLAPTLAVTCCMLGIPFTFTGLSTLRIKETDRLSALCSELLKISFIAEADDKGILSWGGMRGPVRSIPSIDTFGDHRMAMSFAPVSIFCPGIEIRDAEVVEKSYPGFWDDLRSAGFIVVDSDNIPEELRHIIEEQ